MSVTKEVDEIRYMKKARKFIASRSSEEKLRIYNAITDNLSHVPPTGDVQVMQGHSDGSMRLRVGCFRILFRYDHGDLLILEILDIGNRGDVYK